MKLNQKNIIAVIVYLLFGIAVTGQQYGEHELVSVEFKGNNALTSELLQSVILTEESPGWFSQFLNSFTSFGEEAKYFDSLIVPNDVASLKALYESRGYFKNKVSSTYRLNDDSEVELTFLIEEGDPTIFRKFDVYGLNDLEEYLQDDIFGRIGVDTTEIYSDAEVERNVSVVLSFLRDRGFVFSSTESPTVMIDTLNNRADIEIKFSPGEKYKIDEVRVQKTGEGKENVDDELIREIVGIDSGDTYSYINMRRGQIRLYRTNLFTSALVTAVIADTMNKTIPIGISADVGKIHEISPDIFVNDEENAFNLGFGLSFIKKNFLGSARKISLNISAAAQNIYEFVADPSINDTTLSGSADARIILEQPFVFGAPIETKFETYYTLQKRRAEYNAILYGLKLGFDFELPPYTYFNYFTTYLNLEKSEYKFHQKYLNDREQEIKNLWQGTIYDTTSIKLPEISDNINAILGVGLGANKTNDFLFPSKGYNLSLVLEDGNALGYAVTRLAGINFNDPLYYKTVMNFSFYLPLTENEKSVFAGKIKVGYLHTYRGSKFDIPLNQRFYAGGSNSIRGWNTRELVPKTSDLVLPENPTSEDIEAILSRGIIPGGFFMLEGSFETRTRLLGPLGSAFFVDYGNSWNSYGEVTWDEIAIALGVGLRYYSEIVPVRIDFGFKFYDPSDRRSVFSKRFWGEIFQFHLGIGEAF